MTELKRSIEEVIKAFDDLLFEECAPIYQKLRDKYYQALKLIEKGASIDLIERELAYTVRMLMEAPPANDELGLKILKMMDRIYKQIQGIK